MNSNTSFSKIANTLQDDDENYLSIAEADETSPISSCSDLHSSLPTQIPSVSASQQPPVIHVMSQFIEQDQVQEIVMDNKVSALYSDALADDCEHSPSLVLHSLTQDIPNDPPTIMINETFCSNDHTDRLDTSIRVDANLIMMAMSSATISDNLLPFATTSDNSNLGPKSDTLLSTRRTVRFQDEAAIPTVSIMQDHPQLNVTNVPFIHSVVLCTTTSSFPTLHSIRHSPKLMNAEDWRTAFPEPNLESFDNSIYVKVAIQAMTIEDVGNVFPAMSTEAYGDLQN